MVLPVAYMGCRCSGRRSFTLWRQQFLIPPPHLALLQIAVGIASVLAIVGALQALLPRGVAWASIATAYVAADLTATLSTVPGGWGVLESVVVWLLRASIRSARWSHFASSTTSCRWCWRACC